MPGHDDRVIEEDHHGVSDKNNNSDSDDYVNDVNNDDRDRNDIGNDNDDDNDNRDDYDNDDDDNDGDALGPSVPLCSSPSRPQRAWTEEVGRLERLFDHVKNIFLKTHPVVGRRSKDYEPQ